jgi:tetratricopeptide (TPR) repeat protein
MTVQARRLIAEYDNNVPEQLACVEKLLKLFPQDERLSLSLLFCLRNLGRRADRLQLLESLVRKKDCHSLMWKELAIELRDDSREHDRALKYLLKTHRQTPWDSQTNSKIAGLLWDRGKIPEATDIFRFVACSDHKNEGPARSYFIATRRARRTEEAVAFLRERFHDYGDRSGNPIRTLFYALEQLDRVPEAFTELEKALALRPTD